MELQHYRDTDNRARVAMIVKEGRKWMNVMTVHAGRLKIRRRPMTDKKYMTPLETNERKAKATIRRLARKPGTPATIKRAVKENL